MGEVAERLVALSITVSSPDGNLEASVQGREPGSLSFRPGAYERYTEAELAHQLARTATLLFVRHDQGVQKVMTYSGLHRPRRPAEAVDEAGRRYLEKLPTIHASGTGPQQLVRFETTGLMDWRCEIAEGTLRYLAKPEFIGEAMAAVRQLLREHQHRTALLRNEYYGSGLPTQACRVSGGG
jgi:hypothetical protein